MSNTLAQKVNTPIINRISVKGLFGYLDYNINVGDLKGAANNVALLYGDNGAGKTTILKLIYASLSANSSGLRAQIVGTKFKSFSIWLDNEVRVRLWRQDAVSGGYTFTIFNKEDKTEFFVDRSENDKLKVTSARPEKKLGSELKKLEIDLLFINDKRRIRSTLSSLRFNANEPSGGVLTFARRIEMFNQSRPIERMEIDKIAERVADQFRIEVLQKGRSGQANSDAIYLDLAKRVSNLTENHSEVNSSDLRKHLLDDIDQLEIISSDLLDFGVISEFPTKEMRKIIGDASATGQIGTVAILRPYIESAIARTRELKISADDLKLLISTINGYFKYKNVDFDMDRGLRIQSARGDKLLFSDLSSGEQHLFFILCSVFLSRKTRTLFLIDEPELSLNFYWQRQLPKTMVSLSKNSPLNFVMATHSLEILTEFGDRICELEAQNAAA